MCQDPLTASASTSAIDPILTLGSAALLLQDQDQATLAKNPDCGLIPASTMKLLTALHALDHWGRKHRFATDIHLDANNVQWIKGLGAPYLVSEEIDHLINTLKGKGVQRITHLGIDASLFSPTLRIPGHSSTNAPYDAPLTALTVNVNAINIRVTDGKIHSAESQTLLTPLARSRPAGQHRIHLKTRANALRYAGELFAAKLANTGIRITETRPIIATVPPRARLILRHLNSPPLDQIITNMLKHANDLFELLNEPGQTPLTLAAAQRAATDWAKARFNWRSFSIRERCRTLTPQPPQRPPTSTDAARLHPLPPADAVPTEQQPKLAPCAASAPMPTTCVATGTGPPSQH